MQEKYYDGTVGPVQFFDELKELNERLKASLDNEEVEEVKVFRGGSEAERGARMKWNKLSKNQKKNIRKKLLGRG